MARGDRAEMGNEIDVSLLIAEQNAMDDVRPVMPQVDAPRAAQNLSRCGRRLDSAIREMRRCDVSRERRSRSLCGSSWGKIHW